MNWIVDQTKKINPQPIQFYRYLDDWFALFSNQDDILNCYQQLHKIHVDIQFTYEIVKDHQMPFLDVWIDNGDDKLKLSPPVLSGFNESLDTRFSRGTTQLMSWLDGERYLRPLQSLVVSLLSSLVFTLLFSRTGGVVSLLNSSTHRFPRFPPRNLCSLVTLAVFFLVCSATDTAFC